jgi:hypothetical protein
MNKNNSKLDEMVEGYLAGLNSTFDKPPHKGIWTPAFTHGWLNGRDDRVSKPREIASVLRNRAEMILKS